MNPNIRQTLQQGILAHNKGNLRDAERLYRSVLKFYPKSPDANHNLGLLAVTANKPDLAIPLFKTALEANQNNEQFWLSYIDALIKEKKFERVKKLLRKANKQGIKQDRFHELYNTLGITLKAAGKLREAEVSLRKAVSLSPNFHVPHINLGNTLLELGRAADAVECFKKAISLKPDFAEAHVNLANTLQVLGKLVEAEASYEEAISLNPEHFVAHNNLGFTLSSLGRSAEAEKHYKKAIALNAEYPEAYVNVGNLYYGMQKLKEAEKNYRKAIEIKPDYAEPYLNLCELLEKTHRLEDVFSVIKNGRDKVFDREDDFLFYEACIFSRQGNYERVSAIISKLKLERLSNHRKTMLLKLKADFLHHKKDFDGAFKSFWQMNENAKKSPEYQTSQPDQYYDLQKDKVQEIAQLQNSSPYQDVIQAKWVQPTFLIGFPRSGTTLLDTILRSHSKIEVAEEQPMVMAMLEKLGPSKSVSDIENIDDNFVKALSDVYLNELSKHVNVQNNALLIDKLPLNILSIPLIKKVFPSAKFILVLRHPLDCVLSCWMQNFRLNPAMANMVDLNRTVDFYCTVMEMLKLCEQRYRINIYTIRYEDLVANFAENVSGLLAFFDLSWEKEIEHYQKTALTRDKINTPSYSQVVKPIYDSASYRWKNYNTHLLKFKPKLETWAQSFGYEL